MDVCRATRRDGEPCRALATTPNGYCWAHDPANAERRREAARRAGSARHRQLRSSGAPGEVAALKAQLQTIADGVMSGDIPQGRGAVSVQALNALARVLELERRWRELSEVEDRLDALEGRLDGHGRAS